MILENAKPRLIEAMNIADNKRESQEVKFIYNELLTIDTITSVFDWLFKESRDFTTRHDEFRFVIIVHPYH